MLIAGNSVRNVLIANINMESAIAASTVREALIKWLRHSPGSMRFPSKWLPHFPETSASGSDKSARGEEHGDAFLLRKKRLFDHCLFLFNGRVFIIAKSHMHGNEGPFLLLLFFEKSVITFLTSESRPMTYICPLCHVIVQSPCLCL